MPLRVLVTGFEPFDGAPFNPSGEAARALDGRTVTVLVNGRRRSGGVTGRVLPVLWTDAGALLVQHIGALNPHIVISVGMAAATFRVEQRADDAQIDHTDNLHRPPPSPRDRPTRFRDTRLPVASIERAIQSLGASVESSRDAGGFICDKVFLALMDTYHSRPAAMRLFRAGFIHVPNDRFVVQGRSIQPLASAGQIPQSLVNEALLAAIAATLQDLTDAEFQQTQP
jgi:pyroglutamyl-peptidase